MSVNFYLTPFEVSEDKTNDNTAVVIDVWRSSTTFVLLSRYATHLCGEITSHPNVASL